jgi:PAS domain S-box-containing protein
MSLDELLQITLDEIEALTSSTVSFFHFLQPGKNKLWKQAWSTNTIQRECTVGGDAGHHDLDDAGVWADCVRMGKPDVHNDFPNLENRNVLPDGHVVLTREMTVPIIRDGQAVAVFGIGNKPKKYTPEDVELVSSLADFAWDIIERKRIEDALRESEVKFRTLADWTYDWELWVDSEGEYVYISPSCERTSGYRPEEFINSPTLFEKITHPDDLKRYLEHKQLIHDETAGVSSLEYRIIARDGSEHWIDHVCRPLFDNDNQYLGRRVSNRDITLRKAAEKEIIERIQKENLLTQSLQNIQLEIARDLHDTVGQSISYLRMRLDHLNETHLQTGLDLQTEIGNMLKAANDAYDLVRGNLDLLQAGGMGNLLTLFSQYATQVEERAPFKIDVISSGKPKHLSPNQVRQLFFVFREALSNIEKHANAQKVLLEIDWTDECLSITLLDDGEGFRMEDIPTGVHYGLKFMQERIEKLNGKFTVQSEFHQGTAIKISVPFE